MADDYDLVPVDHTPQFADGGSVEEKSEKKATKYEAHYRGGTKDKRCAICSMFEPPSSCTSVNGQISPRALCDFFERIEGKSSGGRIDATHTVHSGANSSTDGDVFIDRRIPKKFHKYLAIHEREEATAMADGAAYPKAHNIATQVERNAVEMDGLSWKEYTHSIDGYLATIEHEHDSNPPHVKLHVDPNKAIGHHHSRNKK